MLLAGYFFSNILKPYNISIWDTFVPSFGKDVMKRALLFLTLLFLILLPVSAGAQPDHFQSEIDFAKKAIKDGYYEMAENKLNLLLTMRAPKEIGIEAHLQYPGSTNKYHSQAEFFITKLGKK